MRASTSAAVVFLGTFVSAEVSIIPVDPSIIPSIVILPPLSETSTPPFIIPLPDNLAVSSAPPPPPIISSIPPMPMGSSVPLPAVTSTAIVTEDIWTYSTTTIPGTGSETGTTEGVGSMTMPPAPPAPSTSTKTVTSSKTATGQSTTGTTKPTEPIQTNLGSEGRGFGEVKMVALELACVLGVFMFA
ncbi:uncharacterized protein PAC_00840 [Phialocephala subalpina]|uniref:Uncharacterized protein n=1 Tax=Phialocephala subalpina TaxID=576137 RepID=A0A1L7WDW0_9HELO|nr:uncharacterized protein PAC_00840 [Phialocephala subalpina]